MSGAEGMMSVSHGVHYGEHNGTKVEVLFGQEMVYVLGAEGKATVGMESQFNIGAKIDVGAATNTALEFGAEVHWTRGWAVELAEEGGGAYHHTFAATAGASKSIAFARMNLFLALSILAQAILVGTSLGAIKSWWEPHTNSKGEIAITGNPGFFASVTTTNLFTGALASLLTVALPKLIEKIWSFDPNAALSLNHAGYAFLGSSSATGSGGLELSPTRFHLSFDASQRSFSTTGHEATSFSTDGSVYVQGNKDGLAAKAPEIKLTTPLTPTLEAQLLFTKSPDKFVELFINQASSGRSSVKLQEDSVVTSMTDGTGSSSSTLKLTAGNAQLTAVDLAKGTGQIELDGANISIKSTQTGGKVCLTSTGVEVAYGTNSVKLDLTGVTIAGSALTILAPCAAIPDASTITQAAAANAKAVADAVATAAAQSLAKTKQEILSEVANTISNVQRTLETQIGKVSTLTGT